MRIALLSVQIPFIKGGAEMHVANLQHHLQEAGHEVATVTLPFREAPPFRLLDQMMMAGLTDLSEVDGVPTDLAIGLKFPAWMIQHPNKVYWVIHQLRSAYDEWESGHSWLLHQPDGASVREAVRRADIEHLGKAKLVAANSQNVASRMKKFTGIDSVPLYHPPPLADQLTFKSCGDYLFFPSRLNPSKRQELVIEALAHTKEPVRLRFSGTGEAPHEEKLRRLADEHGVADRIEWLGWVDDDTLLENFANARAIVYPPRDEDYGYVTLQSMLAGKAVLTCDDSGGALEFVRQRETGLITSARPEPMAEAMDELWQDAGQAETWGHAGRKAYDGHNISWQNVVETLVSGGAS